MSDNTINFVVIGGGVAGLVTTIGLMRKVPKKHPIHVTIVDKKDYFEYHGTWTLRTMVNSKHVGTSHVNHFNQFGVQKPNHSVKVLGGHKMIALDSENQTLTVEDVESNIQKKLVYDYLVLATGSSYTHLPFIKPSWSEKTLEARTANLDSISDQIKHASHILIVGGGAVGVEMLGELNDVYPTKKVTLVHNKDRLLERSNKHASEYIMKWIEEQNKHRNEKNKIDVILNDRVLPNKTSATVNGRELDNVGLVLFAVGPKPNTDGFADFGLPLDSTGRVQVDEYLRVRGMKNVYALGDINNTAEEKSANTARLQSKYLSATLKQVIENNKKKNPKTLTLKPYQNQKFTQMISLGAKHGLMVNDTKIMMKGKLPGSFKSYMEKNMIVGMIRNPDGFLIKSLY
jgi:NADH dehydrogenase FAD-containing subunit